MRRILVLEDQPMIAIEIADELSEHGIGEPIIASTVAHALSLLARLGETFDAAVLDIALSDGDCQPVIDVLEQRGIAFVIASGYAGDPRFADRISVGKPWSFGEVANALTRAIESAGATAALNLAIPAKVGALRGPQIRDLS